jgi:uncharacterized phage infection (PIP) family protein YhgE
MCFLNVQVVSAQKIIDRNQINDRIRDLRDRLKQYHSSIRKGPETVELKLEKISEELENREDVAVTVLFHDPEVSGSRDSVVEKAIEENSPEVAPDETADESADYSKRLEELLKRRELYGKLRAKVELATRSSQKNARNINNLLAQIE